MPSLTKESVFSVGGRKYQRYPAVGASDSVILSIWCSRRSTCLPLSLSPTLTTLFIPHENRGSPQFEKLEYQISALH